MLSTIKPSDQSEAPDKPQEVTDPKTGEFTRMMTPDEYKAWVRQSVTSDIWRRVAQGLSFFGLAAIVVLGTATLTVIDSRILLQVAAEKKLFEEYQKKLDSAIEEQRKRLEPTIRAELKNQIETGALKSEITNLAVTEITSGPQLETAQRNLNIKQSMRILLDKERTRNTFRETALLQILLLGQDKEIAEAIHTVLSNREGEPRSFHLALQNYRPPADGSDPVQVLVNILERAATQPAGFTEESWRGVRLLLEQRRRYVNIASEWVHSNRGKFGGAKGKELTNIVTNIASVGGLTAAGEFVDWIRERDEDLTGLGLHGLANLRSHGSADPADVKQRYTYIRRTVDALARLSDDPDGLSDYLTQVLNAMRTKDRAQLKRHASSNFANQRMRELLGELIRTPENRNAWLAADRDLRTVDQLRQRAQYEGRLVGDQAHRAIAALFDTRESSGDWQNLLLPITKDAGWANSSSGRLLMNSWVQRLRTDATANVDDVATLFINAHVSHQASVLLSDNFLSYRELLRRADDRVIQRFLQLAPRMIGGPDRAIDARSSDAARSQDTKRLQDLNEATILSEVLTRAIRNQLLTVPLLNQMRDDLQRTVRIQRDQWFAAIAQTAGDGRADTDEGPDLRRIVRFLADRAEHKGPARSGSITPSGAIQLLYLLTSGGFLRDQGVQSAVEVANLHMLNESLKETKLDDATATLANNIAADVKKGLRWVGNLPALARSIEAASPVSRGTPEIWFSFEADADRLSQLIIEPPLEVNYLLIDSSERVITSGTIPAPESSRTPMSIDMRTLTRGRHFVRLIPTRLALSQTGDLGETITVHLRQDELLVARALQRGAREILQGTSFMIATAGDDDAWLRLNAKANVTYVLRTHTLRGSSGRNSSSDPVDTVIEVYLPNGQRPLDSDDDGGSVRGGERLSSLLQLSPDSDTAYDIRIENIGGSGTFIFEVTEKQK